MAPRKRPSDYLEEEKIETAQLIVGAANFPGDREGNQIAELQAMVSGLQIEVAENRGVNKGMKDAKSESRANLQLALNIITILISLAALIVAIFALLKPK